MDCTICANESSRGRGFSASLPSGHLGSVDETAFGRVRGISLAGQPPRRRWFLRFVEERGAARCYFVSQKLWSGDAPEPPKRPSRAMSMGAERRGGITGCRTRATRPSPAVRRRERASTRLRSSIIRREDVEFLGRKPETGGTPTPPGVEFVRYRRSHGLGFHETAAKTPRIAVRAVFRGSTGYGKSITWMAGTQSAKEPPTGGSREPQGDGRLKGEDVRPGGGARRGNPTLGKPDRRIEPAVFMAGG